MSCRAGGVPDPPGGPSRLGASRVSLTAIVTSFLVILLAELPDKTIIACLVLGSRSRPGYVFAGGCARRGRRDSGSVCKELSAEDRPPSKARGDGAACGAYRFECDGKSLVLQKFPLLKCQRLPCAVVFERKLDGPGRAFGRERHFNP